MQRFVLATIFSLIACCAVLSADESGLLFRHTFEQEIKPDFAKGADTAKFLGAEEQLKFGPGLTGKGLISGLKGQALRFAGENNFPGEAGTVMFWMSAFPGTNWQQSDRKFYIFFEFFGGGGWLRLYKYHLYSHVFLLSEVRDGEVKRNGRVDLPNSAYVQEQWNHFAFTWNCNGRMSVYINGVLAASSENFPLPKVTANSFFQIGQAWGDQGVENRVMDNLQIFDRTFSNYEIMARYREEGSCRFDQIVSIGKTLEEPLIDGKIGDEEWQSATIVPLLIENGSPLKVGDTTSSLRLMYGEKDLFLAFQSPIPEAALADPHGKLLYGFFRRNVLKRDENVDHDDSLDIQLIKEGATGADLYRMVVNTIDTAYDYVIRADKTVELQWKPNWTVKSEVSEEGWKLEAKIPFAGLDSPMPQPGERWKMNFTRIWKQLKNQQDSWSVGRRDPGGHSLYPHPFGEVVFVGEEHVALNRLRLRNLHKMQPEVEFELVNHSQRPRNVQLRLGSEKESFFTEDLALEAHAKKPFAWKQSLAEKFPAEFQISILDLETQTILYQQQLPLWAERLVEVHLRSYPSSRKIALVGDLSALDVPPSSIHAFVTIRQDATVQMETSFVPKALFFEQEIDISSLKTGTFLVTVSFRSNEKEISRCELTWENPAMPEWYGNQLGISNEAPPPWTAVQQQDNASMLRCWGREYHFGQRPFLTRIKTAGQELLARPAAIMLRRQGEEIVDLNSLPCQKTILEQNDGKVRWRSSLHLPGLEVSLDQFLEFDGFLWTEMTLVASREPVMVDQLNFLLALPSGIATLINPYDYSLTHTGYLPEKGWSGEIRPLWLGNEEAGLQFVAESSHSWQVEKRVQELEVRSDGREVRLAINLINKPTSLEGSHRYAFGLQATPVKPMHPDHRRWRIGWPHQIGDLTPEKKIEFIAAWCTFWAEPSRSSGEVCYPNPKKSLTKANFAGIHEGRAWSAFPYYQLHETWAESAEFKQFGDEWLRDLKNRHLPKSGSKVGDCQITVCQAARSHQDFILSGYERLQRQANPRGYYYDMSQPGACNNVYHGCGYRDEYGQCHSTFNILGNRELVKRIYFHLKGHRPDGMLLYHNSGQIALPVHSFADLLLDGENTYSRLDRKENRGYEKFLTLDTYRAQYMGHNFGPAVGLLPQFTRAGSIRREEAEELGPQHAEYVLGLVLLHDSQLWIAYFYDDKPLRTLYTALEKHDFATGNYSFIPYWKQKIISPLPETEAVASFYVNQPQGKALLVLMNMSGKSKDISLPLDTGVLGFAPKSISNACHSEAVMLENGRLQLPNLPSHTYRLLVLE